MWVNKFSFIVVSLWRMMFVCTGCLHVLKHATVSRYKHGLWHVVVPYKRAWVCVSMLCYTICDVRNIPCAKQTCERHSRHWNEIIFEMFYSMFPRASQVYRSHVYVRVSEAHLLARCWVLNVTHSTIYIYIYDAWTNLYQPEHCEFLLKQVCYYAVKLSVWHCFRLVFCTSKTWFDILVLWNMK